MRIYGRDESLRLLAGTRSGLVMVRADPGLGVSTLLEAALAAARAEGLPVRRIPVLPTGLTTLSAGLPDWPQLAVIVVDDLHRADDATLLALHELADRELRVITGRHRGHTPARFAALDRIALVHDLEPLSRDAVRAIAGESPLTEAAGGNPLLLSTVDSPDRAERVAAWATELAGPDATLLRCAALLAEPATVDELGAVSALTAAEVLAGLGRLTALGLVRERAGQVWLRYPLVRADLASTSVGMRGQVARALARRGSAPTAVAEQLAGLPVTAWTVSWLVRHADRLAAAPTPAAVELLTQAVHWLPPGAAKLHPLRAALAEALLWSGHLERAGRVAAAGLATRVALPLRQRLRTTLARVGLARLDPDAVLAALGPERRDGPLAAIEAFGCLLAGDLAGAIAAAGHAEATAADHPVVAVALLNLNAIGKLLGRDLAGALELLEQAEANLDIEVLDPAQWLLGRLIRGTAEDLRQDPEALKTLAAARPVAATLGAGYLAWQRTAWALAAFNRGHWDEAVAEVDKALAPPGDAYGMARPLHGLAAIMAMHRGNLPAAREHVRRAEATACRGVAAFYEHNVLTARAMLADLEGDSALALELVRTLADGGAGVHHGHSVTGVGARVVRIAVNAGDKALAARMVATMHRWTSDDSVGQRGALLYCQGMVDGDVDLLLAAAKEFAEHGSPIAAARAGEDAARVLAASGEPEAARAAYQQAISHYTGLAATGDIDRATAALRAHGVRRGATGPRRRPKHGWAALTEAEYRVAELLAEGRSNREVADRLVVSVRTVHSHVSRVLAKLGYATRVEVALGFQRRD
ncbi:LuxR C-terminal-related transcriptional regulator [Crossiella sp. CA198]|uniref:LuxR C-terminal-related transcriptional regulator n=1 Tax=Crossiella sp. CA198 TaxID=3455607 RepID=UPI003F8D3993